ncbi:hypothetical protein CsSME_00025314 [Camellia sinensis var. sinensis]
MVKSIDIMKERFCQAINTDSRDDVSMKSVASQKEDDNAFSALPRESQDPNEKPTLGDFGDSLSKMISEKTDKNRKGKDKV